jgi:beta-lactamase regulating signal transducer with metallopeptidase domain
MNWLHYLLEANIYLAVFYAGYQLFLKNETYYTLNRVYLLLSCILSFVLPLTQIGVLKAAEQGVSTTVYVVSTGLKSAPDQAAHFSLSIQNVLFYAYLLGVIVMAVILLLKLFKLTRMTSTAHKMNGDKYKIVPMEGSNTAFSFFNYLFIGSNTTVNDIIIRHELVHIRQKHTLDVIFLELVKIVNWFNPFVYLLQNSIKTVHEYIADEKTAAHGSDVLTYSSFLVNNAYGLNGSSVTHSFFNYNLLKKRIIMLNQKRSGNLARLRYLVAVPICAAALCASTLGFSKNYALIDLAPQKIADTTKVWSKSTDNKNGVKLDEIGSVVNNKTDFEVTITDKQGNKKAYRKSTASAEDKKLLQEKYGYTFPDKLDIPTSPAKIANMPPPPPVPPTKTSKSAPKVKRDVKVTDVKLLPPPAAPEEPAEPVKEPVEQRVPPPPPPKDPFNDLYTYIGKHVRYPTIAHNNLIAGKIIVTFNINKGKIEDAKITKGLYDAMDAEVLRVIKNYDGTALNLKGNYAIPVTYTLIDQNNNNVGKAPGDIAHANNKPEVNDIIVKSGPRLMLNEVVVAGYVNTK